MKILYVAKHNSGGGDDEGAIAYALEQLGHEVVKCMETFVTKESTKLNDASDFDLCLFHKWSDFAAMKGLKCPKAFWFFDLVDWPQDPTLASRCEARKRWMADVIPLVDVGFCTDGDWVERVNQSALEDPRCTSRKLVTLRQGADEWVVGFGEPWKDYPPIDVLFVGGVKGCGVQRESFVKELKERYGSRFTHFSSGVYGRALANAVASSKVVVCPDSPVTDRYWSNRVYVMAGFGACLVHPGVWTEEKIVGVIHYRGREEMFRKIDYLLSHDDLRTEMSRQNLDDVRRRHLYRHRCEELIRVVRERGIAK